MYTGTFGPVSNRADWYERISLIDRETSMPPDVTEIVLTVGAGKGVRIIRRLSASEVTCEAGVIEFTVPDAVMRTLSPGTHQMGILLTTAGVDEQLFTGSLDVVDGVVP